MQYHKKRLDRYPDEKHIIPVHLLSANCLTWTRLTLWRFFNLMQNNPSVICDSLTFRIFFIPKRRWIYIDNSQEVVFIIFNAFLFMHHEKNGVRDSNFYRG